MSGLSKSRRRAALQRAMSLRDMLPGDEIRPDAVGDDLRRLTKYQRDLYTLRQVLSDALARVEGELHGEVFWRTSNGRVMRLREMTDGHMANAIRLLERDGGQNQMLDALYHEMVRRRATA